MKPAGSEAGAATIVVYSSAPASSSAARIAGDRGALLADGDVDAVDLLFGSPVAQFSLLVDDRVDRDRGLAGLAVADDQLALAAADRGHGVDGLDAGLQRLVDAAGAAPRWAPAARGRGGSSASIAPRPSIGLPSGSTTRPRKPSPTGTERISPVRLDRLALLDAGEVAEDDGADLADVEVQREAEHAVLELEQLVGHGRGQALDAGDAVTGLGDRADLLAGGLRLQRRDVALRSRSGSPPGEIVSSVMAVLRSFACSRSCCRWPAWARRQSAQAAAGGLEPARDAAVDDLVADPHDQAAERASGRARPAATSGARRAGSGSRASRSSCSAVSGTARSGPGRSSAAGARRPAPPAPRPRCPGAGRGAAGRPGAAGPRWSG